MGKRKGGGVCHLSKVLRGRELYLNGADRVIVDCDVALDQIDLTGVRMLIFLGYEFNRLLVGVDFKAVEELNFVCTYDESFLGVDFGNVQKLGLFGDYSQDLAGVDFKHIKHLQLGPSYIDEPLCDVNLGEIETLILGAWYSLPLDGVDFKNVKYLDTERTFNWPLDNVDLGQIETLILGTGFSQPLSHTDLKKVRHLIIQCSDFPENGLDGADLSKVEEIEWRGNSIPHIPEFVGSSCGSPFIIKFTRVSDQGLSVLNDPTNRAS